MHFDLPPHIFHQLAAKAQQMGISVDDLAAQVVGEYLLQTRIATAPRSIPSPNQGQNKPKIGPEK